MVLTSKNQFVCAILDSLLPYDYERQMKEEAAKAQKRQLDIQAQAASS